MANFAKLALTAQRLILANGRSVTLVKFGSDSADSDKPWRGRKEYNEAEVTGSAAFVPAAEAEDMDGAVREKQVALFAAADDTGLELEFFDEIVDGTTHWKIDKAEVLAPAATRVLYKFEVSR